MRALKTTALTVALISFAAMADLQTAQAAPSRDVATASTITDLSAQARRRPRVRIYRSIDERGVYPSYFPGSNAVRDCTASYVQEFRPSGTVIVPRMNCFWRRP